MPAITGLATTAEASLLASSTTTSGMPLRVQRLNFPRFNGHQNLAKVKVSNGKIQQSPQHMAILSRA